MPSLAPANAPGTDPNKKPKEPPTTAPAAIVEITLKGLFTFPAIRSNGAETKLPNQALANWNFPIVAPKWFILSINNAYPIIKPVEA